MILNSKSMHSLVHWLPRYSTPLEVHLELTDYVLLLASWTKGLLREVRPWTRHSLVSDFQVNRCSRCSRRVKLNNKNRVWKVSTFLAKFHRGASIEMT